MRSKVMLCSLVVIGLGTLDATAEVYDLRAAATTRTMSDGMQIPMWGFGLTTDATVSIPGPVLVVPPGDTTLTINLTNQLPVPVSIVIPQLPAPLTPVWNDGTTGPRTNLAQRVVSFTHVAQPGQTVVYQWTNVPPGTYAYHSGTHPAVQVPMGLYGAVKHDAVAEQAYDVAYDRDLVLVYSEIDPSLNLAVGNGTYGTPSYPTTIDYRPRYHLINGQPMSTPLPVAVGERILIRTVNAGLRTAVPTLTAGTMRLLAEDGHRSPFARDSYALLLTAGQTRDALLVPTEEGTTVLFDRRGGTVFARLTATQVAPVAIADAYTTVEDTPLVTASPGVLANDDGGGLMAVLDGPPANGSVSLSADGAFSYTPSADFNGVDSFAYHVTNGMVASAAATVSITVTPANDPPIANATAYSVTQGTSLTIAAPGLLANDSDVDADPLSAVLVQGPSGGALALASDGSFLYTPNASTQQDSFTYRASDGVATSNVATVTLTVEDPANAPPIAQTDFALVWRMRVIDVVANDTDSDGTIDPTSVVVTTPPSAGTATPLGDGRIRYRSNPGFRGFDSFQYIVRDDDGAMSAPASVLLFVWRWP